ncbi:MAG: hypothetical protein KDK71_10630, partial [Chlamydiia bacterium]|nr:hypothetical protein [Chlamydiia bacterium]
MESSFQDFLLFYPPKVQGQNTGTPQTAKNQPDYSLPDENGLVVGIKKTLVAFSERFTNFFSSSGRARNLLGKPTENLTTALKLISKLNEKLEGTPFDKITFANFQPYIKAIQEGKVLKKGERFNPANLEDSTKNQYNAQELQELLIGVELANLAKNQTTDKTTKATSQLFKTAEKAINAWQKAIVDAGKDLKHDSFTALVKAATDVALETYKKTHSLDENSEEFQEMKTFLEKESGKIWATFSPDKYVKDLADTLEQELDF